MTLTRSLLPVVIGSAALLVAYGANAQDVPRWTTGIGQIFADNCTRCHGGDNPRAGLNLTSYETAMAGSQNGPVLNCGTDADLSVLIQRITGQVQPQMPRGGAPLPVEAMSAIGTWIQAGCPN